MPELRTDWLTGRTVIVAEERAGRPNEFAVERGDEPGDSAPRDPAAHGAGDSFICPFCPGQEDRTPPAVLEKLDASGNWQVRVVPNLFPAVKLAESEVPRALAAASGVEPAVGVHEVIIETPRHVERMSAITASELHVVLETFADRFRHWRDDGRFRYGLVFKNQGQRAGASLGHVHSQFIALPAVPPSFEREMRHAKQDYARHRSCPYCRLIEQERSARSRIVLDRDGYVAYCPYASWQPWEVWLLPAQHRPSFELPRRAAAVDRLAGVLHDLIGRIESILPEASYNLLLRTAPWIDGVDSWCHWRIELLPRVTTFAGLELAAGIHINPLAPEHAAAQLRGLSAAG